MWQRREVKAPLLISRYKVERGWWLGQLAAVVMMDRQMDTDQVELKRCRDSEE